MNSKICACLIVKNEAHIIERCLKSVLPIVTYWMIDDSGSTDQTVEKIQEFLNSHVSSENIKDSIKDFIRIRKNRKWVNFSHNRNALLKAARKYFGTMADYFLLVDADYIFHISEDFHKEPLNRDAYFIEWIGELYNSSIKLIRSNVACEYYLSTHEDLIFSKVNLNFGHLKSLQIEEKYDGDYRSHKYITDIELLKSDLLTTDITWHPRICFYLAMSYYNLALTEMGANKVAIEWYQKRLSFPLSSDEIDLSERYLSIINIQLCQRILNSNQVAPEFTLEMFKAWEMCPYRLEAIFYLMCWLIEKELFHSAILLGMPFAYADFEKTIQAHGHRMKNFVRRDLWNGKLRELLNFCLAATNDSKRV